MPFSLSLCMDLEHTKQVLKVNFIPPSLTCEFLISCVHLNLSGVLAEVCVSRNFNTHIRALLLLLSMRVLRYDRHAMCIF